MRPARPSVVYLAGPTAVGKSAVALELARRLDGEVLSADSMQVYRGMDIGTAKPGPESAEVPHHLIDLVSPLESFDAARWLKAAHDTEREVYSRGRVPIYCGGTGLYFRALFEGLDAPAPRDAALRSELEAMSLDALLEELWRLAPERYLTIDRRNPRRVVRAVEILRLAGEGGGNQGKPTKPASDPREPIIPIYVMRRSPEDLRQRIEWRVDRMFSEGLVEETRRLMESGLGAERTAMQAIGYRQVVEHLNGGCDLATAVERVKARTRQYARRQMTWFRHRPETHWVDVSELETAAETAERILTASRE